MTQVVIVGAGPTGCTLALLLVKHGIAVTLVEAAKDFRRVFRGEGLMPSGLDALEQMGLSSLLDRIPHRPLEAWDFIVNGQHLFRVDEPMGSDRPCTLVSQPPLLEALIAEAQQYETFEWIQGVAVKDLCWTDSRVTGIILSDGRELSADLVIGADGRNSVVRQRAGLSMKQQPKSIDVLWFKLPAHPRFVDHNVFCSIVNQDRVFSIFHGAEAGKLHLAWVLFADEQADDQGGDRSTDKHPGDNRAQDRQPDQKSTHWAETFAALSPDWLATHFRDCAEAIASPIRLSVVVGRCPCWHKPGVLLLGDSAHPMSPVRAQGINMAFRDVIVAANHLVPLLKADSSGERLDSALAQIQAEREPEIIRAQKLQTQEASRGELLRKNALIRAIIPKFPPILRSRLRHSWVKKQQELRRGITSVQLNI